MTNLEKAARAYRLPETSTPENIACGWSCTVNFGKRFLVAGYYYSYKEPCYYGAVYEYLTDDHTCEGTIGLAAASEVEFEDDGHAIAWAMAQ